MLESSYSIQDIIHLNHGGQILIKLTSKCSLISCAAFNLFSSSVKYKKHNCNTAWTVIIHHSIISCQGPKSFDSDGWFEPAYSEAYLIGADSMVHHF